MWDLQEALKHMQYPKVSNFIDKTLNSLAGHVNSNFWLNKPSILASVCLMQINDAPTPTPHGASAPSAG